MAGGRAANPRRLAFIAGISLAVLAFALVLGFGLAALNQTGSGPLVDVVTASRDIAPREQLTADAVTISRLPQNTLAPGALSKTSDARGMVALVTILKGQTITTNLIAQAADEIPTTGAAYLPIPAGYVARALPTNEQQGVGGYIAAGDYIDVSVTVQTGWFGQTPNRVVTRTVFSSLHVIRVGPSLDLSQRTGASQGVVASVTVVMTACDAAAADWLIASGARLTFFLLSYKDYGSQTSTPDPVCPAPSAARTPLGPAAIDARFGFTKA
jgi:Flp pilus assembly protein CpaB